MIEENLEQETQGKPTKPKEAKTTMKCVFGKQCRCQYEQKGQCTHKNPCVHIDCCTYSQKETKQQ